MTTAQEKLVVRVSLGAAAAAPGDLPAPITEQHWHWRRIAGAVFTLCAAALLLYGWLHIESPDAELNPAVETAPVVITTESIESTTPELVLEAVQQNPEPEPVPVKVVSTETASAEVKPEEIPALSNMWPQPSIISCKLAKARLITTLNFCAG